MLDLFGTRLRKFTAVTEFSELQDETLRVVAQHYTNLDFQTGGPLMMTHLCEEVGEVARAVGKLELGIRGTREYWIDEIEKELGDVLTAAALVASCYGMNLDVIAKKKIAAMEARRSAGT